MGVKVSVTVHEFVVISLAPLTVKSEQTVLVPKLIDIPLHHESTAKLFSETVIS